MNENKSIILKQVSDLIQKGEVVAFTGAGISVESRVPAFRGESGLWEKYDANTYANLLGLGATFLIKPKKVVGFITDIYETILNAMPNPAHLALASMEEKGILNNIITQNIDNLHQRAGNRKVIELHGNLFFLRCLKCGNRRELKEQEIRDILSLMDKNLHSRIKLFKTFLSLFPKCSCKGQMRPDIVLFGEELPEGAMELSFSAIDNCKTFLMVGTSGVVYPAASLPRYARRCNKKIVEINDEETSLSAIADYKLLGKASEILKCFT